MEVIIIKEQNITEIIIQNDYDGDVWNFHIESWNTIGGTEIYDNEFYGGDTDLDVAGDLMKKVIILFMVDS